MLAENAVDPAGIETERPQPPLKRGDVVATQRRRGVVEQAVAGAVTRLHQRAPGLRPADAVHMQAPRLLERAHRGLGALAEEPGPVGGGFDPDARQSRLEVADRFADVAAAQQRAYRNSWSSWSS